MKTVRTRWIVSVGIRTASFAGVFSAGLYCGILFYSLHKNTTPSFSSPSEAASEEGLRAGGDDSLAWSDPAADTTYAQAMAALSPPPKEDNDDVETQTPAESTSPREMSLSAKPPLLPSAKEEGKVTNNSTPETTASTPATGVEVWKNGVWSQPLTSVQFPSEDQILKAFDQQKSAQMKESIRQLLLHARGDYNKRDQRYLAKTCAVTMPPLLEGEFTLNPQSTRCLHWLFLEKLKSNKIQKNAVLPEENNGAAPPKIVSAKTLKTLASRWQKKGGTAPDQSDWDALDPLDQRAAAGIIKIKEADKGLALLPYSMTALSQCRTTGASIELFRELEPFMPEPAIWKGLQSLYGALGKCLKVTQKDYAFLHGRMGLLFLQSQMIAEAQTALDAALKATDMGEDDVRVLFWRGYLEALSALKTAPTAPANPWWQSLVQNNPMTLHALVADRLMGIDSFERLKNRPVPQVVLFDKKSWSKANISQAILLLSLAKNDERTLRWYTETYAKHLSPESFEHGLMLAVVYLRAGNIRLSIAKVFDAIRDFGADKVDAEVLSLMYPTLFKDPVLRYSGDTDPTLVFSLIRQESSFHPRAKSVVGAMGLMQVMPATAKQVMRGQRVDLFDPKQNVQAGARYLGRMLQRFEQSYVMTIASYNAGPTPVERWKVRFAQAQPLLFADLIPYPETKHYVSILLRNMHWYGEILNHRQEPWFLKLVAVQTTPVTSGKKEQNAESNSATRPAWTVAQVLPDAQRMATITTTR